LNFYISDHHLPKYSSILKGSSDILNFTTTHILLPGISKWGSEAGGLVARLSYSVIRGWSAGPATASVK
jgi:hypothetical protein